MIGQVYLAPAQPVHKIEITDEAKDWKLVGYVKDLNIDRQVDFEDINLDEFSNPFRALTQEKVTISAQFTPNDTAHLYTIYNGLLPPVKKSGLDRLKELCGATH